MALEMHPHEANGDFPDFVRIRGTLSDMMMLGAYFIAIGHGANPKTLPFLPRYGGEFELTVEVIADKE